MNHLKQLIFPMIKVELPERKPAEGLARHVEQIKMLDHHQEAIARRFDTGHHIIIGPSGSGKTLVLVHKAAFSSNTMPRSSKFCLSASTLHW